MWTTKCYNIVDVSIQDDGMSIVRTPAGSLPLYPLMIGFNVADKHLFIQHRNSKTLLPGFIEPLNSAGHC